MSTKVAKSFINGEWLSSDRNESDVISPYTREKIGVKYTATEEDVERALKAAFESKREMKQMTAYKRAEILKNAASLLQERKEEFAKLISTELGKPLKNTLDEVDRSVETLELSGEEAKRIVGETIPGDVCERGANTLDSSNVVRDG